jgi:Zn-dependent protease
LMMTGLIGSIPESLREPVLLFLWYFLTMNISLAIFNLLPFPPLDGSKILETFLPPSARPTLELLERFGFIILMFLIYVGFFGLIMRPVMAIIEYLLYLGVD